jgi:RHS repeat-associated protein
VDVSGNRCETITSLPFGDAQSIAGTCGDVSPKHFTGKERDTESGLDNIGARYDASSLGRLMTPDPLGGHQEDPQTLNKYAYVRNNPTTLTDPTGLDFNLSCDKNNDTTCQGGRQYYQDKNGDYQETVVKSDEKGNLTDQSGNKYSGTVDEGGIHFSSDGGKTSSTGSWVDGSNETKFTQQTGALAGFRFDFSQPGKGQSFSGTFSADTNFYGVKSALKNAGFSVSYLDELTNVYEMYHNWSLVNFRSPGDPDTGQNSVHFLVNPGDKIGLVVPTTGKFHGYETDPNKDPFGHLRRDVHGSVTPVVELSWIGKHPICCLFLAGATDAAGLAAYLPWSRTRCCCGLSFINPHVRHSWLYWLAPLVYRNGSSAGYVPVLRSTNSLK